MKRDSAVQYTHCISDATSCSLYCPLKHLLPIYSVRGWIEGWIEGGEGSVLPSPLGLSPAVAASARRGTFGAHVWRRVDPERH